MNAFDYMNKSYMLAAGEQGVRWFEDNGKEGRIERPDLPVSRTLIEGVAEAIALHGENTALGFDASGRVRWFKMPSVGGVREMIVPEPVVPSDVAREFISVVTGQIPDGDFDAMAYSVIND